MVENVFDKRNNLLAHDDAGTGSNRLVKLDG